jgi:hypothetical protein
MSANDQTMGLRETMDAMHRLLRGEISPNQASGLLGAPVERLAVYQNFVKSHIATVLEKDFPILRSVLGQAIWSRMVNGYFQEYPADSYELNQCAKAFPEYLDALLEIGEIPELTGFHAELALHEWTEFEVFSSETRIPHPGDILHPILNPTLEILEFDYPVSVFVRDFRLAEQQGIEAKRPDIPFLASPEVVFILRHPQSQLALFYRASDQELFAFKLLHDKIDPKNAELRSGLNKDVIIDLMMDAAHKGLAILPSGWSGRKGFTA